MTGDHTDLKATQDYAQRVASTVAHAKMALQDGRLAKAAKLPAGCSTATNFVFARTSDTLRILTFILPIQALGLKTQPHTSEADMVTQTRP